MRTRLTMVPLQLAIGNMANIRSEVEDRHPSLFDKDSEASSSPPAVSRTVAISSVYHGVFIGMNSWRCVGAIELPGRLSGNNTFQRTPKSPIELVQLSQASSCAGCDTNWLHCFGGLL